MTDRTHRVIRMFCDHGAEWPLWEDGMVTPQELGLTPALTWKLRAWADVYLEHMRPGQNWLVSKERDDAWFAEGRRLGEHLARELQGVAAVDYTGV
jgi:hypothetical protein